MSIDGASFFTIQQGMFDEVTLSVREIWFLTRPPYSQKPEPPAPQSRRSERC